MTPKDLLYAILDITTKEKYPDIHLNTGYKPIVRNHEGDLIKVETLEVNGEKINAPEFTKELIKNIIIELGGYIGIEKFIESKELDISYKYENNDRYRVNCYMDSNGYSIALRIIPNNIPTMEELNLGDGIKEMCNKNKGLILVTGPTGSGKSTNLASMIDYINKNFKKHIITIEDPVEFAFKNENCLINQREVGNHTKGFAEAIRASLREDPDVIMVGEMRDPETIKAAITLAETGHLVFSTLHTNDTVQSVDRIIDVFPAGQQDQIRMQLAMSLIGIISQRLLPRIDSQGRIPAREILVANDAIRNLIITGKTHQLYSVLEVSSKQGMILMDKYLIFLYKKKIISKDTLFSYVRDKEGVEMLINE
ncbi:MAG: type IV pilus twitching motility protein PilT [Candidatus Gracilibacteria bacterium]|nr:type IV pilus twitching motility protein PilT [Candidatus Gracilibacteria bacterium]